MQVLQDFHKTLAFFLVLACLVSACGSRDAAPAVTAKTLAEVEALLEDAGLTEAALTPETTSLLGLDSSFAPSVKSRLRGVSQAAFERQRLLRLDLQARLNTAPDLPPDHPLARDLMLTRIALQDVILLQKSGKGHLSLGAIRPYTIDPYAGLWIEGPQTLVRDHVIETPADAEAYLARMADLADGLQDTRRRLLADAATGHLPPAALVEATRLRIETLLAEGSLEEVLTTFDDFSRGLPETETDRSHQERLSVARTLYETELLPAYVDLVSTLAALEGQTPIPTGLWTQPGGVTLFADLLSVKAEPGAKVDDLWASLEEAVASIQKPTGSEQPSDGIAPPRPQPEPLTEAPEILYRPTLRDGIVRQQSPLSVESFYGQTLLPARLDNRRPVILEWSPGRLAALPAPIRDTLMSSKRRDAERLYEDALTKAARRSPVRGYVQDPAFAEAWFTYYAASLQDAPPQTDLQDLQTLLAYIDLALHAKRWSLQDAVDLLLARTDLSEPLAREAVLRLSANPGEAAALYVHRERFKSLERRARQILDERFELAAFHAVLLKDGPRPLPIVERDVETWYQSLL